MTTLAIKDLPENVDLDRQAMLAITGGARRGGRPNFPGRPLAGRSRLIDYPGSLLDNALAAPGGRPAGNTTRK